LVPRLVLAKAAIPLRTTPVPLFAHLAHPRYSTQIAERRCPYVPCQVGCADDVGESAPKRSGRQRPGGALQFVARASGTRALQLGRKARWTDLRA
jgi:hypothetical protein